MKRSLELFLVILLFPVLLFFGCAENRTSPTTPDTDDNNDIPPGSISGTYSYTGYTLDSVKVVYGTIILQVQDSLITGQRELFPVDTLQGGAFEAGIGMIEGVIRNSGEWLLDLTPGMMFTLYVDGYYEQGVYQGKRIFNSGAGPTPTLVGSFTAVKTD